MASFAQAPAQELVAALQGGRPARRCRRSAPGGTPRRWPRWGVDAVIAQGREGGGHTGPGADDAAAAPGGERRCDVPVLGAGGFFDGRGLVAALAYGAAGVAMGTRFLLSAESTVPDAVKKLYLETPVPARWSPKVDGDPQRVVRTASSRRSRAPAGCVALARAARPRVAVPRRSRARRCWRSLREGLAMKQSNELTWADGHGGERADADEGEHGRGPHRGRRPADRAGRRRHRGASHRGGARRRASCARPRRRWRASALRDAERKR